MVAIWCIALNSVKIAAGNLQFLPETCNFCRKSAGNLLETMKKKRRAAAFFLFLLLRPETCNFCRKL
ncbi:hypothetical protein Hanom_Chr03g00199741 [Helianthus anomalus]